MTTFGEWVVSGVLDQIQVTVKPVASLDPMVIFLLLKYTIGVDIGSIWKNPHLAYMTSEDRIVTAEKHRR